MKKILELDTSSARPCAETLMERKKIALGIVDYCKNLTECRRVLLLRHFGEQFHKKDCDRQCSNCANDGAIGSLDLTKEAKEAVALVKSLPRDENVTALQFIDIFRGANTSRIRANGHKNTANYGMGKGLSQVVADHLFSELVYREILVEEQVHTTGSYHSHYLKVRDFDFGSPLLRILGGPEREQFSQGESHATYNSTDQHDEVSKDEEPTTYVSKRCNRF
jgi:superfamily II DNA helicase RecQ